MSLRRLLGLGALVGSLYFGGCKEAPPAQPAGYTQEADPIPRTNPSKAHFNFTPSEVRQSDFFKRSVVFVLDSSGSMIEQMEGGTKLDIAKQALGNLVERYNKIHKETGRVEAALYQFRDGQPHQVIPMGPFDYDAFRGAITNWTAHGGTPLTKTIAEAQHELNRSAKGLRSMIILTDGDDTGGPVAPGYVAQHIKDDNEAAGNPSTTFYVTAFGLGDSFKRYFSEFDALGDYASVVGANDPQSLTDMMNEATSKIMAEAEPLKDYVRDGREIGK